MHYTFPITRNENPKPKPDPNNIGFAKYFTDHMFFMEYDEGKGYSKFIAQHAKHSAGGELHVIKIFNKNYY